MQIIDISIERFCQYSASTMLATLAIFITQVRGN